ncbi:MAG: NAD-dependent epimerase/dehydratase family protein [Bacteroidetes bacterium]|nr:NAD-dependent epimerase/dehydratase family protein [Bacteroidota bacterium]MBS1739353.1 NAD-dependent epimerase/dehydratase family protein [Bacteroidota bacterium]
MNSPTILVTGASGLLGQHLVHHLSKGNRLVRALYHHHPPDAQLQQLPNIIWQPCDLLDVFQVEEVMGGIEYVYHCAAVVSFSRADRNFMLHFNVESTANLVNEALEHDVRKFVFVSSIAALGRTEHQQAHITESVEWEESNHNSHYGLSKYLAELEVWRGAGEGLNITIVNPGIILGEPLSTTGDGWNKGSSKLMTVVNKQFPFYTQGINAWVDVKDVVQAMTELMQSNIVNERFILCAGNFAYKEIFSQMALLLEKKSPHIPAGKLLTSIVWRFNAFKELFTGKTPTITKETATTAQRQSFYCNEKLLQWIPNFTYTPIHQTLARMASAFKSQKTPSI